MELHDALQQIAAIRQQMAQSELFRGYRSVTVGFSGLLGILAAGFQPFFVVSPTAELGRYLTLWVGVAILCAMIAGIEMLVRADSSASERDRMMTRSAIEQFLPCLVVGALVTICIYRSAPQSAWMLPGLWSMFFGLGIFASRRMLPTPVIWAALYYVICGCFCLRWGQGIHAFSPWQMAISFGGGQLLCASIFYWTLERRDVV